MPQIDFVLDPEDVSILASIAENPHLSSAEFDELIEGLSSQSREIATAIRDIANNESTGSSTPSKRVARSILEWVRENRAEAASATISSTSTVVR
jgi:hypothetical protein